MGNCWLDFKPSFSPNASNFLRHRHTPTMPDESFSPPPSSSEASAPRPPLQPVTPSGGTGVDDASATSTGLAPNVAAGLACVLTLVTGIIFLVIEQKNRFVRFWAMQAVVFGAAWFIASIVLTVVGAVFSHIPLLNIVVGFLMVLLNLALFVVAILIYIVMLVKAFGGQEWEVPVLGKIARQQLARLKT